MKRHEVEIQVYVTDDSYVAQVEDDEHLEQLERENREVEVFSAEVPDYVREAIILENKLGAPHEAYKDMKDHELLVKLARTAIMYADEMEHGHGDFDPYDSKTMPKAVKYRAKVLQQYLTELSSRVQAVEEA